MDTESEAVTFASDHDSLLEDGTVEDVLENPLENTPLTSIDRPRLARIATNEDAAAFRLIEILDRAGCSDKVFSEVISWARDAYNDGFDFVSKRNSRK